MVALATKYKILAKKLILHLLSSKFRWDLGGQPLYFHVLSTEHVCATLPAKPLSHGQPKQFHPALFYLILARPATTMSEKDAAGSAKHHIGYRALGTSVHQVWIRARTSVRQWVDPVFWGTYIGSGCGSSSVLVECNRMIFWIYHYVTILLMPTNSVS